MNAKTRRNSKHRNTSRKHDTTVKIAIVTRFSVYNHGSGVMSTFAKHVKTHEQYMEHIYSPSRLEAKMRAFEHISLPSITHQSYKNLDWYIYTSPTLPAEYLNRLKHLTGDDPRIQIRIVKDMGESNRNFNEQLKKYRKYISLRLDDDDGIHPQYCKLLAKSYKPGNILNPSHGLKISLSGGNPDTIQYSEFVRSAAASGLALAQGNILSVGNHTKIHSRWGASKITTFPYRELTLFSVHGHNISKARFNSKNTLMHRSLKEYWSQKYLQTSV